MDEQEITQEDTEALTIAGEASASKADVKMSLGGIVQALKKAVTDGNLTPQQAARMRRDMGIGSGFFTDKKLSPIKRKNKNKAAKAARKANRKSKR